MASKEEDCKWLTEHLRYELWMLQWSYALGREKTSGLDWNIHYECFAVHARLLKEFLTNKGGPNNYEAQDFIENYKQTVPENVLRLLNKMNEQVFHPAKRRPSEPSGKVTSVDLTTIYRWLDEAMKDFLSKLPSPFREYWKPLEPPVTNFTAEAPQIPSVTMTSAPTLVKFKSD